MISITCTCGQQSDVCDAGLPGDFCCSHCRARMVLARTGTARVRIHVVDSDLAEWLIYVLGWMVVLPWYPLGYATRGNAGFDETYATILIFALSFVFALFLLVSSDGLKLLTSLNDYRPLFYLGTLGGALAMAGCIGESFWTWLAGIIAFGSGWCASLATSRAPIQSTIGIFGAPLSVGEVGVHVGATADIASIRDRLPDSVFMLRSFADDHNPVEDYPWAAPGGGGGVLKETLERTLSVVANRLGLIIVKLGRQSDAEASYAISTTNQDWQAVVAEINQKCRAIVMVPGRTPGVAWEIETLIRSELLGKTLLTLPREPSASADLRWNALRELLAKHQITLPAIPAERNWDPISICIVDSNDFEWFVARRNRLARRMGRRAYLWCLTIALGRVGKRGLASEPSAK